MDGARARDSPKACPPTKASHGPSRHRCRPKHKGRPKSLNLPPEAKHPADAQRSFKTKTRTSEERPKWPQEEVGFWLAWGSRVRGREQRHLCSPQVSMRVSSPCVQLCMEVLATPVHASDAIVNAEEILLRLIGGQGSQ